MNCCFLFRIWIFLENAIILDSEVLALEKDRDLTFDKDKDCYDYFEIFCHD